MRLNKYLAAAGVCSRREADRLIEQGLVTVDGETATVGRQVEGSEEIRLEGKAVKKAERRLVVKYYKPRGVDCTKKDPHAEKTIFDLVKTPIPVTYAGRLDRNSEGLLLLTNDGDLIEKMMRGSAGHEKEYEVTIDKEVTEDFLETVQKGIYLKELGQTTGKCRAWKISGNCFRIVLTQGLNRQIRRMCEACGCRVQKLRRLRVVNVTLEGLKEGQWSELTASELSELFEAIGYKP